MIVAERKPLKEISRYIGDSKNILIVGCGSCTSVCLAGGEKEVKLLGSALRLLRQKEGKVLKTAEVTIQRQCEDEYVEALQEWLVPEVEAVVSLGCGIGVQYIAQRYQKWVVPGLNTCLAGGAVAQGVWEEKCILCGECILYYTGGICPLARCAKGILNGPCGGSQNGKCELNQETDCAWYLIFERLQALGKLEFLRQIMPPKDWSKSNSGGPRKLTREDMML